MGKSATLKSILHKREGFGLRKRMIRFAIMFVFIYLVLAVTFATRDYYHEVANLTRTALSEMSLKIREQPRDARFEALATSLLRLQDAQSVLLLDKNGKILEQYGLRLPDSPATFDVTEVRGGGAGIARFSDNLVVAVPLAPGGERGYAAMTVRMQGFAEHLIGDAALVIVVLFVLILLSVQMVLGFLRDVVAPIGVIKAAMGKAASGEHIDTVEPQGLPEVRAIMQAYNDLIAAMVQRAERLNNQRDMLEKKLEEINGKETKLRDSEDWFRGIFNFSTEAMVIIDEQGVIVEVNAAAQALFGYARDELVNKRVEMLMPLDERPRHQGYLDRYLQGGKAKLIGQEPREVTGIAKNGESLALDLAIGTMRLRGKVYFLGGLRDATERRQARDELARARDQALESARLKDAFLANINHELRTPLNGILGTLQLVDAAVTPDERRAYFDIIRESGRKLLSTVTQVLDFARIDAGTLELDRREMDPVALVLSTAQIMGAAVTKNLYFVVLDPLDVKVRMLADSLRLRQAVTNVVENAIKFTDRGGVIVTLQARQRDKHGSLVIDVRDTGCGIEPNQLTTIFDQFSQSGRAGGRGLGGTGLGLATAKKLAVLMGGGLNVQSRPGAGSDFRFEFPVDIDGRTDRTLETRRRFIALRVEDAVLRDALGGYLANHGFFEPTDGQQPETIIVSLHADSEREFQELQNVLARFPNIPALVLCHPHFIQRAQALVEGRPAHIISGTIFGSDIVDWLRKGVNVAVPSSTSLAPPHVLIVEDNPVNQRLLMAMVGRLGLTGEIANNGEEGVKLAGTTHFDLVLMDCLMPVLDGYDATRQIRALPDVQRELPIVAVTANALEGDREKCLNVGMSDYLPKPVNLDSLRNVLKKWIVLPDSPATVLQKVQ